MNDFEMIFWIVGLLGLAFWCIGSTERTHDIISLERRPNNLKDGEICPKCGTADCLEGPPLLK